MEFPTDKLLDETYSWKDLVYCCMKQSIKDATRLYPLFYRYNSYRDEWAPGDSASREQTIIKIATSLFQERLKSSEAIEELRYLMTSPEPILIAKIRKEMEKDVASIEEKIRLVEIEKHKEKSWKLVRSLIDNETLYQSFRSGNPISIIGSNNKEYIVDPTNGRVEVRKKGRIFTTQDLHSRIAYKDKIKYIFPDLLATIIGWIKADADAFDSAIGRCKDLHFSGNIKYLKKK